ncbi:MAG: hypothetical protein GPJ54_06780 [Candidatus Heimdallarchaeota archaeon]|nr:hypothetical protein [Candidatus Heimdallarchaeota archaeon]
MKKALVLLTLIMIFLPTLQTSGQIIDSKTAVTDIEVVWSEYSEFISYQNKTYQGLQLTIQIDGELWNSANNEVEIPFGSSSCPDFGKSEANFTLSFINLPIDLACTDDYGIATYAQGLTDLSYAFSVLFLNQTLETLVNGSMIVSFPMINLSSTNVFTTLVTFSNSQVSVDYSTLPSEWGAIANSDSSETSDEFLELGFSFLQSFAISSTGLMVLISINKLR